jgi:hypothetical protein
LVDYRSLGTMEHKIHLVENNDKWMKYTAIPLKIRRELPADKIFCYSQSTYLRKILATEIMQ